MTTSITPSRRIKPNGKLKRSKPEGENMTEIIKDNEGKRVELIQTDDPYTKLKPGDRGTYQFFLKQQYPLQSQHCIKWDNGSTLSLLEGKDSFKFI